MRKFLFLYLLLFSMNTAITQQEFQSGELESFVTIYMEQKNDKMQHQKTEAVSDILFEYKMSHSRYKEILTQAIKNDKLSITKEEKAIIEHISRLESELLDQKQSFIKNRCSSLNLDLTTYEDILYKYKSDINFQRSIQPYFLTYFKSRK